MKICAVVCEYNPFHNGHRYLLEQAKLLSKADKIVCIMSGNFVQRGECAILPKEIRSKHAILGGADAVIELPAVFATSTAEIFAKGAISVLSSIPEVTSICFGAETNDKDLFIKTAKLADDEPEEITNKIQTLLKQGKSYVKARSDAYNEYLGIDFVDKPNNILGIEYTRAIKKYRPNIEIIPVKRVGSDYNDTVLQENLSSATSIRDAVFNSNFENIKNNIPDYAYDDLINVVNCNDKLLNLEKSAIIFASKEKLQNLIDVKEGIENAIISEVKNNADVISNLTSKRYTSSRIKRILLQNLLSIDKKIVFDALNSKTYIKPILMKKDEELLSAFAKSPLPLLIRAYDKNSLNEISNKVLEIENNADAIYRIITNTQPIKTNLFI